MATTYPAPKTLSQVRDALCHSFSEVMNDPRRVPQIHEASNALGKAISACKIRLEACTITKQRLDPEWTKFIEG